MDFSRTELILLAERYAHDMRLIPVHWSKPEDLWVKLNYDGSSLQNLGPIGGGGIIRDSQGDLLYVYSTALGQGSNNLAKMWAAVFGIAWYI